MERGMRWDDEVMKDGNGIDEESEDCDQLKKRHGNKAFVLLIVSFFSRFFVQPWTMSRETTLESDGSDQFVLCM